MKYIKLFDPWNSKLCTCPKKYTFNPYTGCGHSCLYCYASYYIKNFHSPRVKSINFVEFEKEARKITGQLISLSNSTDPYQPLERIHKITRKALGILVNAKAYVQIITKSNLVVRDIDLLLKTKSMVSITITTVDNNLARKLEPGAPSPSKRLKAIEKLVENNIPVAVRIDPVIPYLTEENLKETVEAVASAGAYQVISSTYKVRPDNWQRFSLHFPDVAEKLHEIYFKEGERISRYFYLPKNFRYKILVKLKNLVERRGLVFSTCRENLQELNSAPTCDGSWKIFQPDKNRSKSVQS